MTIKEIQDKINFWNMAKLDIQKEMKNLNSEIEKAKLKKLLEGAEYQYNRYMELLREVNKDDNSK